MLLWPTRCATWRFLRLGPLGLPLSLIPLFLRLDLLERQVQDRILLPILVIEMPPFGFVDGKAFGFHRSPQEIALPALWRGAAGVGGIGAIRHFVVAADHGDGLTGLTIVQRQIHRAAAIVA